MTDNLALSVSGLSKCYLTYANPGDRLKQFFIPKFRSLARVSGKGYYREFWALRDISFDIYRGETVGIIGRNGSGKSTLLQLICGTIQQTQGEVAANGRIAALLELGSGFNPEFSGRENVFLNAAVLGMTPAETAARFSAIEAFAEIGDFINEPVKSYSSGMVVRLAFSVAIHVEPQILIIDEALSVGDERFQRKCFGRLEAIRQSGATILFVSHSASTIVELCDRTILLDNGELLMDGAPKEVVARYQKLLYAPEAEREAIRTAIRSEAVSSDKDANDHSNDLASISSQLQEGAEGSDCRETFDPHLIPASTLEYESRGARIEDPAIYTLRGDRVNGLVRGRRYEYRYRVRFEKVATLVRFGMLMRTVTGLELGGAATTPLGEATFEVVSAGSVVEVCFAFDCRLAPGTYFLNAGVVGDTEDGESYLYRIIDAVMFRVLPEASDTLTGTIDFCCVGRVIALPATSSAS
jgi:lipopolysaccharide transport system ATP-binding protein